MSLLPRLHFTFIAPGSRPWDPGALIRSVCLGEAPPEPALHREGGQLRRGDPESAMWPGRGQRGVRPLPRDSQGCRLIPGGEAAPGAPAATEPRSSRGGRGGARLPGGDAAPRRGDSGQPLPGALAVWRCPAARGWWSRTRSRQKTKSAGHRAGSERIMQRKPGNLRCGPPSTPDVLS